MKRLAGKIETWRAANTTTRNSDVDSAKARDRAFKRIAVGIEALVDIQRSQVGSSLPFQHLRYVILINCLLIRAFRANSSYFLFAAGLIWHRII